MIVGSIVSVAVFVGNSISVLVPVISVTVSTYALFSQSTNRNTQTIQIITTINNFISCISFHPSSGI